MEPSSSRSSTFRAASLSSGINRRRQDHEAYERERAPIIYDEETDTLTYASQKVSHIPLGLWNMYPKTKRLDLSYNHINSLINVEKFEELRELILDNNCITERIRFPVMHLLKLLSVNNNRINDLPKFIIKVRQSFPHLRFLSLIRNEACPIMIPDLDSSNYQCYRLYILSNLPRLKYLDFTKVESSELEEAEQRGHLLYIRHPRPLTADEEVRAVEPLPRETFHNLEVKPAHKHRGEYMRTKICFANRESEGNRFIMNQDL